jgi:Tol biopolymer transport system component/DNA-binding winged helix-turn-helix (wHTH) protein
LQGSFRIGEWRVQPQINCVTRDGTDIHLEPKVMQVLVLLSEHQGEVVSKDRLLQTVWPGVFVGEDVLTRSISEIRRVLADDARSPRFIQTIPKSGYRLIAPVTFDAPAARQVEAELPSVAAQVIEPGRPMPQPVSLETTVTPARFSLRRAAVVITLLVLLSLTLFLFWFFRYSDRPKATAAYITRPLTSYPGSEGQAAFSPDGNQIAFVWNGINGDNKDIYVKLLGAATPLRLTTDPADDVSPAWSPDGRFIAFIRHSSKQNAIYIVPAIGGAERMVYTLTDSTSWEYAGVTWSKDGGHLIFPDRTSPQAPSALFSISIRTLAVARLTSPPPNWDGDWTPVVSPDGSKIAFVRGAESAARDVYVMNASDQGEPTRLTYGNRLVVGLTWTRDGKDLVFSSNRDGSFGLWKVPVSGGTPERLNVGGQNSYSPAISPRGNLFAYSHGTGTWDIVRVDLKSSAKKILTDQILSSNEQDAAPQYSPDGKRIAFQSWRSGEQEIWTCAADGSSPVQLTSFNGPLAGSPRWSPDGRQIAFDSRPDGFAHIFLMSPDGGVPRQLTSGTSNDIVPAWSPDGKWIYFGSNRSGSWQIWKVSAGGGTPQRLTKNGGMVALASPDGQWVYYTRSGVAGLWRIPASGGEEQQVLTQPPSRFPAYWALTKNGIYLLSESGDKKEIGFASYADTRRIQPVHVLDHQPTLFSGLSVSPDQRWLIYADMAEANSNISLVENFH